MLEMLNDNHFQEKNYFFLEWESCHRSFDSLKFQKQTSFWTAFSSVLLYARSVVGVASFIHGMKSSIELKPLITAFAFKDVVGSENRASGSAVITIPSTARKAHCILVTNSIAGIVLKKVILSVGHPFWTNALSTSSTPFSIETGPLFSDSEFKNVQHAELRLVKLVGVS